MVVGVCQQAHAAVHHTRTCGLVCRWRVPVLEVDDSEAPVVAKVDGHDDAVHGEEIDAPGPLLDARIVVAALVRQQRVEERVEEVHPRPRLGLLRIGLLEAVVGALLEEAEIEVDDLVVKPLGVAQTL